MADEKIIFSMNRVGKVLPSSSKVILKVASGVSSAIQSAVLALGGTCVCETDGIIDRDIEKTISNLGSIGSSGMEMADCLIQKIMVCK